MKPARWLWPATIAAAVILGACGGQGEQDRDDVAMTSSALAGATKEKSCRPSKVRICHFPGKKNEPHIIEVSSQALQAHLDHGDGLAPPSVRSDADCLVPQPPAAPVSFSSTTGSDGVARFVVPGTNIRVVATIANEGGTPIGGVTTALLARGDAYLIAAQDPSGTPIYAPAFVEGSLLDARPGSALTVAVTMVMKVFTATFPGVGMLQSAGTIPGFVANQFVSVTEECFTQAEYKRLLELECAAIATAGAVNSLWWFFYSAALPPAQLIAGGSGSGIGLGLCLQRAEQTAALAFATNATALKLRVYRPPFLPGVDYFPLFFQKIGPCGGACCTPPGTAQHCANVSAASRCATAADGGYHEDNFCSADPCEPPTADLEIVPHPWPPSGWDVGDRVDMLFFIENLGPDDAENVSVEIALSGPLADPEAEFFLNGAVDPSDALPCTVSATGTRIVCDIGFLASGDFANIEGSMVGEAPGSATAEAIVSSSIVDPVSGNNVGKSGWNFDCPVGTTWDVGQKRCACPPATPRWNASIQQCEACPPNEPKWNPVTEQCEACLPDEVMQIAEDVFSQITLALNPANQARVGWLKRDLSTGEYTAMRVQATGSLFQDVSFGRFPVQTVRNAPNFTYSSDNVLSLVYPAYDSTGIRIALNYVGQLSPGVSTPEDTIDMTTQGDTALAFDPQGRPWVFYLSSEPSTPSGQRPRFAHWNGSEWLKTTVDAAPYLSNLSMAINPNNGEVYAAYSSAENDYNDLFFDVIRLSSNGSFLGIQRLESTGDDEVPGLINDLKIDSAGRAHTAYLHVGAGDDVFVKYARDTAVETIATIGMTLSYSNVTLALDKTNTPYVCYNFPDPVDPGNTNRMKVMKRQASGAWVEVASFTASDQVWDVELAIGADNSFHVVYVEGAPDTSNGRIVRYVKRQDCSN